MKKVQTWKGGGKARASTATSWFLHSKYKRQPTTVLLQLGSMALHHHQSHSHLFHTLFISFIIFSPIETLATYLTNFFFSLLPQKKLKCGERDYPFWRRSLIFWKSPFPLLKCGNPLLQSSFFSRKRESLRALSFLDITTIGFLKSTSSHRLQAHLLFITRGNSYWITQAAAEAASEMCSPCSLCVDVLELEGWEVKLLKLCLQLRGISSWSQRWSWMIMKKKQKKTQSIWEPSSSFNGSIKKWECRDKIQLNWDYQWYSLFGSTCPQDFKRWWRSYKFLAFSFADFQCWLLDLVLFQWNIKLYFHGYSCIIHALIHW